MAEEDAELTVAERLGRLLDRGLLPAGGPAEAAERLIERLQRPARVALLGLPGSGKSAILNLLAGTVVVPETLRLPTIIVQYGDVPRMLCTLADGHTEAVSGTDLESALTLSPALITLELNLPALKVISLLEVAAGPLEAEQRRAALWAGKRADILIWCTTSYLPKEQLVWEGMPDAFKDNGFLLLTKVDLLGGREAAAGMHHRVSQRASGEFRQVLSVSAKEARAAAAEGGDIDRARFRESGASAVISTIKSRVQMAQRADTDTAELILARHGETVEASPRPVVEALVVPPVGRETIETLAAEAAALERVAAAASLALAQSVTIETNSAEAPDETLEPVSLPLTDEGVVSAAQPVPEPNSGTTFSADPKPEMQFVDPSEALPEVPEPSMDRIAESPGEGAKEAENTDEAHIQPLFEVVEPSSAAPQEPATTDDLDTTKPERIASAEDDQLGATENETVSDAILVDKGEDPKSASPEVGAREVVTELADPLAETESVPETPESSARFTARLKQIPIAAEAAQSGLIPLRATWKSRADIADPMPIEPKPAPNKNPTPRARLSDPSGEARLVGKLPRIGDGSGDTGSQRSGGRPVGPGSSDGQKISTEPERPPAKITSVFGARPRAAPAPDRSEESASDDLFPPLPVAGPTSPEATRPPALDEVVVDSASLAAEMPLDAIDALGEAQTESEANAQTQAKEPTPEVAEALDTQPEFSPPFEPEPEPEPEPEAPRTSLSSRLGIQSDGPGTVRRDIPGAVRVSRQTDSTPTERFTARPAQLRPAPSAPMPSPQDIVAPRVTVLRERRGEGDTTERRERPRIAPVAAPADPGRQTALRELPAAEKLYLEQAVNLILARSNELAELIDPNEKPPVDLVLQHGLETTEQALAILSRGGTSQLRRITAGLGEVQDLIMLMQLEKGNAPADDTLTLLLQLRREMETLRST